MVPNEEENEATVEYDSRATNYALSALFKQTQAFRRQVCGSRMPEVLKRVIDSARRVEDCFYEVWDVVSERSGARAQMQPNYATKVVFNKDASDVYIKLGSWVKKDKMLQQHLVKPGTSFKTKKNMQVHEKPWDT